MFTVIRKKLHFAILFLSVAQLNACSTSLNNQYDCPNRAGVSCKSLGEINSMVDQGQIGLNNRTSEVSDVPFSQVPTLTANQIEYGFHGKNPIRHGEQIQKMWLSPYEDMQGNYHEQHVIYSVVNPGYWIGHPVKEFKED